MSVLSDWVEFNPRVKLEKGKEYPFIGMERIQPGNRFVSHEAQRPFTGGGARFSPGDTLFARITPCLENGKIAQFVAEPEVDGFGSTEFFVLHAKSDVADPTFVYYLAQTTLLRDTAIQSMVGASGRQRADVDSLRNLEIDLPDFERQKNIGQVLSRYDDLIETNRRRIALLEESARLLYREWFVNLRFPGYVSARIESGTPEGWSLGAIGDLALFLNRGITPTYDDTASGLVINQKCIRGGRLNLAPARRQSKEVKVERQIQVGDILINSTGAGTLGRVAQVRSPIHDCTVDTHLTIVRPSSVATAGFLGVALLELEPVLSTMGIGSTNQLELGRADIAALPILTPPLTLREQFHQLVWPIFTQAETLAQTNELLVEARDALLPKLMSGQIQV